MPIAHAHAHAQVRPIIVSDLLGGVPLLGFDGAGYGGAGGGATGGAALGVQVMMGLTGLARCSHGFARMGCWANIAAHAQHCSSFQNWSWLRG